MANNEKNSNGTMSLGEISTIRNILMGDQMSNYESKFAEVAVQISESSKTAATDLAALKKAHEADLAALEKAMTARLDAIEKTMTEKVAALSQQITNTSTSDKHNIGMLLQKMGEQLLK